jgi:hypothetical protein
LVVWGVNPLSGIIGSTGHDRQQTSRGGVNRRSKYGIERGYGSGVVRLGDVAAGLSLWVAALIALLAVTFFI